MQKHGRGLNLGQTENEQSAHSYQNASQSDDRELQL
jgi:hypothetical protein